MNRKSPIRPNQLYNTKGQHSPKLYFVHFEGQITNSAKWEMSGSPALLWAPTVPVIESNMSMYWMEGICCPSSVF